MKENLLIATLGTWGIIPEIIGFTNHEDFNLYKNSTKYENLRSILKDYSIENVNIVWLITSENNNFEHSRNKINNWINKTGLNISVKYLLAQNISDLETQEDCLQFKDFIYRVVYFANINESFNRIYLSLAGGRKTMSADLQAAGMSFGCDSIFHVLQKNINKETNNNLKDFNYLNPFPRELADAIVPVIISGKIEMDPVYYSEKDELRNLLNINIKNEINDVTMSVNFINQITDIKKESSALLYNYTKRIKASLTSNFYALNLIHPKLVERLQGIHIGIDKTFDEDFKKDFLKKLPKSELHFHLGGFASSKELIEIAKATTYSVEKYSNNCKAYKEWLNKIRKVIVSNDKCSYKLELLNTLIPKNKRLLRKKFSCVNEPYSVSGLILQFEGNSKLLDNFIFGQYTDEERFCGVGFEQYERLGDLQGSGILQSEETIRKACKILIDKCKLHNVKYLELRCSPENYTKGGLSGERVLEIIREELSKANDVKFGIILIGSRHADIETIRNHINLTINVIKAGDKKNYPQIVGFDLAGNENQIRAGKLREEFLELMKYSINLTIHAGETDSVESIWEAVYHLSADRIGHGLNLFNNVSLMSHFIDRKILIEMCPSSNYQIVGFKDNYFKHETADRGEYPLKKYLDKGVLVSICTDNTGISRTDFTNELVKASRLVRDGLSLWEILVLIRNAFKGSFLPVSEKSMLIKNAEKEIVELIRSYNFDKN